MGLFDTFKKKTDLKSPEHLSLETLLQKASTEPSFREEFYKRLLSDELLVITKKSDLQDGTQTLLQETKVNIVTFPDGKIPVFTSKERIFDKGFINEQVQYLQMKGKNLFELAKGAAFLLNPYSDYGKELLPDEVEHILNGTILTSFHEKITIKKDTPVQIGQPANYPTEMVYSLCQLFSNYPSVRAAYLGWIYNPSSGEPPHFIFAIDGDGDIQEVTNEAGYKAKQFLMPDDIIDFIRIDNKAGLSDYFLKKTKPFYEKK